MGKIKVLIKKSSKCPIANKYIRKVLTDFFKKNGLVSEAEVSVALIGEREAKRLSTQFLKEDPPLVHNVLSFSEIDVGHFIFPPDGITRLGEIVICYPKLVEESKQEGVLIERKAKELLEHGAMHLLGFHHDS